jgi:hypothetical protein
MGPRPPRTNANRHPVDSTIAVELKANGLFDDQTAELSIPLLKQWRAEAARTGKLPSRAEVENRYHLLLQACLDLMYRNVQQELAQRRDQENEDDWRPAPEDCPIRPRARHQYRFPMK